MKSIQGIVQIQTGQLPDVVPEEFGLDRDFAVEVQDQDRYERCARLGDRPLIIAEAVTFKLYLTDVQGQTYRLERFMWRECETWMCHNSPLQLHFIKCDNNSSNKRIKLRHSWNHNHYFRSTIEHAIISSTSCTSQLNCGARSKPRSSYEITLGYALHMTIKQRCRRRHHRN